MFRGWLERSGLARVLARRARNGLSHAAENRRQGRLWLGGKVECSLGRILDVSRGGAHVLSACRIDGEGLVKLKVAGGVLVIPTSVVWCRRRGYREYELGLQFKGATDEVSRILELLTPRP